MKKMISCDWGTSSFRLRLVNNSDLSILAARSSPQGIVATHASWSTHGQDRLLFYQAILEEAILDIGQELGLLLDGVPVVISGMASSSLGMLELPYKDVPFLADGSDLRVEVIRANGLFDHDTYLISGVRTGDDVMRGEETQLVGCGPGSDGERVYIFPGTHSKHVVVRGGWVTAFRTYMTGEFFELLSKKSILARDVGDAIFGGGDDREERQRVTRFEEGVREGAGGNLLHGSFLVRTNRLLRDMSKEENYNYLSGLLIGAELKELTGIGSSVTVVGEEALSDRYVNALGILGIKEVSVVDAGEAVTRGQGRVLQNH